MIDRYPPDQNPYLNQNKPLPFPVALREFERETAGMEMSARLSPQREQRQGGEDVADSAHQHHHETIRISHPVVNPNPEYIPSDSSQQKIILVSEEKTHVPEALRFRYFLSWRTIIEILSVCAAMIPIVVAPHLGAYQRGFRCDDPNIMFPFKEGTVKPWLMYVVGFGVSLVAVVVGEYCRFFISKRGYSKMEAKYRMWRNGPQIPPVLVSITRIILLFIYGFLIVKSITDIAKYTVGRLRPHFLDVCFGSSNGVPLLDTLGECKGRYMTNIVCPLAASDDPKVQYRIRDSRLSFLSGHSSMAFYCAFFVIFYLESRLRWMRMRYCKAILQFALFMMAALTGLSRISDHKHHWDDVFAGALLGFIVSIITVFLIGDFFNDSRFLRYKIVTMLQKLDWGNDEGSQFARLLSEENGYDPGVLRKIKHITRYTPSNPNPKVS
ncbi:putative phosphatidate phosphatase [Hypsibius exemplaris]|uniref:Phosphatidate phosphatase n=1 Tax=Hypsibius exemplaris TaxID=2072580 RepID=A0A1W0XDI8_HYPEX|nr:putative phosphatidate phosphatase [Hypsibius exemplaris]